MKFLMQCAVLFGAGLVAACGSSGTPASAGGAAGSPGGSQNYTAGPTSFGYIQMGDGTRLHYYLQLPSGGGKFPTLFTYDVYTAGSSTQVVENYSNYVEQGYAVIGVNVRGSGCSDGIFSTPDAAVYGNDGAQVVEWIAQQDWSSGHVGMVGGSFPGGAQLAVAGFNPPHLDAISPMFASADNYRDTIYPGGIFNSLWTAEYTLLFQPLLSTVAGLSGVINRDPSCAFVDPRQDLARVLANDLIAAPRHPYFDSVWAQAPVSRLQNIHLPVLGCQTWQDGAVGSDTEEIYFGHPLDTRTTWFEGNNGGHGACVLPDKMLDRFLERYVKGIDNGWESTPHVTLQHEVSTSGIALPLGGSIGGSPTPGWTTSFNGWPDLMRPVTLYLHAGGGMDGTPGSNPGTDSYFYPLPSSTNGEVFSLVPGLLSGWQVYNLPGGSVSYTTPALAQDLEAFGPASVNLWFSSTAEDSDVQVTLTEIRPDRQEEYVARGWLRLSHRKLDDSRSSVVRPYLTDLQQDAQPLNIGEPTYARVEIRPFDHVFRAGSSLRLTIEAPTGLSYGDGFSYLRNPARNTIYNGSVQDSQLVLGTIPDATAGAPLPACNTVDFQPCRAALGTVPSGRLVLPPNP